MVFLNSVKTDFLGFGHVVQRVFTLGGPYSSICLWHRKQTESVYLYLYLYIYITKLGLELNSHRMSLQNRVWTSSQTRSTSFPVWQPPRLCSVIITVTALFFNIKTIKLKTTLVSSDRYINCVVLAQKPDRLCCCKEQWLRARERIKKIPINTSLLKWKYTRKHFNNKYDSNSQHRNR